MSEQSLREQHSNFLSALQFAHGASVELIWNVEALKQYRGISFGCVTVFFSDYAFELSELHSIFVSNVRLLVNLVAFLHGFPQALISHDHGVGHAISVESKLILA